MKTSNQAVRNCVINEVGYLEKKTNNMLDDKTANAGYNNFTKYTRDIDNSGLCDAKFQGQAWCCAFAMWPFLSLYGKETAQKVLHLPNNAKSYNCEYFANYFKKANSWYTVPQVGDLVFFKSFNSDGTVKYNFAHVGIVVEVTATSITTVEGNTSGASGVIANGGGVCKKSYSRSYKSINGYGRPAYDEVVTENTSSDTIVNVDLRMLRKGMTGQDVHSVMVVLKDLGYYSSNVPKYDIEFGPKLESAVKSFQKSCNLEVDGIIGKDTWKALMSK